MSDGTHIEWTEATWNPVTGCSVLSPGCTNCYAMKLAGTRLRDHPSRAGLTRDSKAGPVWTGEVRFNEQWLDQPLRWRRPRMIFVCAHGDLFHEDVPDEWIDRVFAVMALCPQHTFQVLTKRSARMREYLSQNPLWSVHLNASSDFDGTKWGWIADRAPKGSAITQYNLYLQVAWPLPNVWLGVSVEDQARADERIPDLLATPAAVRWLSCEPLLGPVDLTEVSDGGSASALDPECWGDCNCDGLYGFDSGCRRNGGDGSLTRRIDWVVVGGESGPGARPMHPDWARSLRDQCAAAGVPFFFKQWGAWAASGEHNLHAYIGGPEGAGNTKYETCWIDNAPKAGRTLVTNVGKKRAGRLLDGVTHDAMPGEAA